MKTIRPLILIAVAALLLLVVFVWFQRPKPVITDSPLTGQASPVSNPAGNVSNRSEQSLTASLSKANRPTANLSYHTEANPPLGHSKAEQMLNVLSNYNDMPIVFYGRLEDQFGNPVAAATVNFSIRVYNGYESTVNRAEVKADANGLFTISGYKGESLSVVPAKPGYALASTNGGGVYSQLWPEEERLHPDPNNPVIIKMWKLQGAGPLVTINQQYHLPYTNAPIYIDLLNGRIGSALGDLKISVNREEAWNVRVEAVDGGLMDSGGREPVTYWAPDEGYLPVSTFSFPTNVMGLDRAYFVTSRNGQVFSKLHISFRFRQKPEGLLHFYLRGVASTNGSRNWEGDSNTYKPQ